ncbi:MAG TPA: hypothetical protein VL944_01590 [Candidatus Acidoferrum sp.]|nr:hypothetical protein [Candidatus Acidoferrum sp.]
MLKFDNQKLLFVIAAFVFTIQMSLTSLFSILSQTVAAITAISSIAFIAYSILFIIDYKPGKKTNRYGNLLTLLFVAVLALAFLDSLFSIAWLHADLFSILSIPFLMAESVVILLPPLLFIFFGFSLMAKKAPKAYQKKIMIFAGILIAAGAIILIVFFFTNFFGVIPLRLTDEEITTLNAAQSFLAGHNPYAISFKQQLYNYFELQISEHTVFTFNTNNTFESGLDYPALSFIFSAPFAALFQTGISSGSYQGAALDLGVSAAILILLFGKMMKYDGKGPPVVVLVAFLLIFTDFASFLNFLMMALLLYAFYKTDCKYLWVVLGLAASLQEEMWIPVILLLLYSFRNYGIRKGAYNLMGTAVVFLIINSYFIAANPHAYITNVLVAVNGYILPNSSAPFGYIVLSVYHVLLSSQNVLFYASAAVLALLFFLMNEKRLIFIFSLIPFMFLFHAIPPYYAFFVMALVLSLYVNDSERKKKPLQISRTQTYAIMLLIALIIAAAVGYTIQSHNRYDSVKVNVYGASLITQPGNYTYYNASLDDSGPIRELTLTQYLVYYGGSTPVFLGPAGDHILVYPYENISNMSMGYLTNPNRILLNQSASSTEISVRMKSGSNLTVYRAECVLYNESFYYICPSASAK